jgi:WD40 repeat protein/HEAT repeat protein
MAKAKTKKAKPAAKTKAPPPWHPDPEAARWYAGGFVERIGGDRRAPRGRKLAELEAWLGFAMPSELATFASMLEHGALDVDVGEWRIDDSELIVPSESNRLEAAILLDQKNYLGPSLVELLTGSVFVGSAGNGDYYLAHPEVEAQTRCPIWLFDHETFDYDFAIADSLSSLAYLNKLYEDVHRDDVDTKAIAKGLGHIADRVLPSWHYSKVVDVAELTPSYKAAVAPKYYFYRALWILYLLRNDGVTGLERIPSLFGVIEHGKLDLEGTIAHGWIRTYPVTALYWLWRTWFFDHGPELAQVLAITSESPSPLIRDAAALVGELARGRKELGTIADMQALRTEFKALDLDPKRAGAREKEKAAKKKADTAQRKVDRETARELIAAGGDLVAVAWSRLDRPTIVEEIYKHLRATDASMADDFARYDFLVDDGYSRSGYTYTREADDVVEALAATGQRLLPLWATQLESRWTLQILALAGDVRLAPRLKRLLPLRVKYNHTLTGVVRALGALGAREVAGALIGMLSEFAITDDFTSEIHNKETLIAAIEALAALREPTAIGPLTKIAREQSGRYEGVAPKALKALARIGDRRATPVLIAALDGAYRDVAAYALARLGDPAAREPLGDLVDRMVGDPTQTIYLRTMHTAASERPDLAIAEEALGVVMANKFAAVELHEVAIDIVANHAASADAVRLLTPFIDAEQQPVRAAAWAGLARHGVTVTPVWLDRARVDRIFDEDGAAALERALRERFGVFKHNVLRKAADKKLGAAVAEAAVAVARNATRFQYYTNGYVQDDYESLKDTVEAVMKLHTDATDELVEDWLGHPSVLVREAVDDSFDRASKRIKKLEDSEIRSNPRAPTGPGAPLAPAALEAEAFGEAPFRFGKRINGLAWEPNGTRLAVVGDSKGAIYDETGVEVLRLDEVRGYAYDVDWHPDGKSLVIGFHAGHLLRLDATTGAIIQRYSGHGGVPDGVRRVRFSADGARLASASDDETMRLWNTETGKQLAKHADKFDVNCVTFFPDGRLVAGTDKAIHLFDAKGKHVAKSDVGATADAVLLPGGATFACGGGKGGILILDMKLKKKGALKQGAIARLGMMPDGKRLAAASWEGDDCGMSLWDLAKQKRKRLPGHDDAPIWAMRIDPRTGTIAAGGDQKTVVRWSADGTLLAPQAVSHGGEVGGIAIDHAGDRVFTCADSLIAWRLSTREQLRVFERKQRYSLNDVILSPDGTTLYATGMDGCGAWDVATGEQRWHTKLGRSEKILLVDGTLVTGSGDALVWIDPATGEIQRKVTTIDHTIYRLERITGDRLVTADFLGTNHYVEIWNARTGERLPDVPLHIDDHHGVYDVDASSDGTRLYVTCADKSIKVLDTETWKVKKEYLGAETSDRVAISPSKQVIAASADPELTLYDAATFQIRGKVTLDADVECMRFVDDATLLCGLEDGGVVRVRVQST